MNPALAIVLLLPGWVYLFGAAWAVTRFARRKLPISTEQPAISILKPLHGAEPGLYENLRSFAEQDYPARQIVLGVTDPQDGAVAAAQRIDSRLSRRRYRPGDRSPYPRQQRQGVEPRKHAAGGAPRYIRPRRQRHAGRSRLSRRGHGAAQRSAHRDRHLSLQSRPDRRHLVRAGSNAHQFRVLPRRCCR